MLIMMSMSSTTKCDCVYHRVRHRNHYHRHPSLFSLIRITFSILMISFFRFCFLQPITSSSASAFMMITTRDVMSTMTSSSLSVTTSHSLVLKNLKHHQYARQSIYYSKLPQKWPHVLSLSEMASNSQLRSHYHRGDRLRCSMIAASSTTKESSLDGNSNNNDNDGKKNKKQRHKIMLDNGKEKRVICRQVPITSNWTINVYEWHKPSKVIESYWEAHARMIGTMGSNSNRQTGADGNNDNNILLDPFGLVCWPGSLIAAKEMLTLRDHFNLIKDRNDTTTTTPTTAPTVLVLGAGVGVEVQAAIILGANNVIATDYNPITLKLLDYGIQQLLSSPSPSQTKTKTKSERTGTKEEYEEKEDDDHRQDDDKVIDNANFDNTAINVNVSSYVFDLFAHGTPIPKSDILIASDVLYNDQLSNQVCIRCIEALKQNPNLKILITDSQKFTDFTAELNGRLKREKAREGKDGIPLPEPNISWEERTIKSFKGSGVMVDSDQEYDVEARVVKIGW